MERNSHRRTRFEFLCPDSAGSFLGPCRKSPEISQRSCNRGLDSKGSKVARLFLPTDSFGRRNPPCATPLPSIRSDDNHVESHGPEDRQRSTGSSVRRAVRK